MRGRPTCMLSRLVTRLPLARAARFMSSATTTDALKGDIEQLNMLIRTLKDGQELADAKKRLGELKKQLGAAGGGGDKKKRERLLLKTPKVAQSPRDLNVES